MRIHIHPHHGRAAVSHYWGGGPEDHDVDIDTDGIADVEITEAFNGVSFATADGERLAVSMRDSGFEVHYFGVAPGAEFDVGWFTFNNGMARGRITEDRPVVDEARLRSTTDASVWAAEFAKVCPDVDEGLMISWFANAIETAKDLTR